MSALEGLVWLGAFLLMMVAGFALVGWWQLRNRP
jgi:high-affinity Fe2+/Pb2+ permease